MKKVYLFTSVLLLCSSMTFAQLRVASNGNVGIQIPPTTIPLSPLTLVNEGDSNSKMSVWNESTNHKMSSRIGGLLYSNWAIPFLGENTVMPITITKYYVGVYGLSTRTQPSSSGIAYGVMGQASNATSGYNYGVYGTFGGSSYGAGVVGTTNGNFNIFMDGRYAGYFMGNVLTTGSVTAASFVTSSDRRLKTNICSLTESAKESGVLSTILSLNPVQYKLKQLYNESLDGDSSHVSIPVYDEKSQQFQKTHFGLIAQELQKEYPELVYEQDNGYLSVDYVGLIPILIQSAKEMKAQIDVLKSSDASMRSISGIETQQSRSLTENPTSILYQNTFNPYSQEAEIKYYIPQNINSALLCIYDIQGKQLKEIPLLERGEEGVQTILSSEFAADMYLYGLIVDGKVIDMKQF